MISNLDDVFFDFENCIDDSRSTLRDDLKQIRKLEGSVEGNGASEAVDGEKTVAEVESNFQILGEEVFNAPRRITVCPAFVTFARQFETQIGSNTITPVKSIPGFDKALSRRVRQNIEGFFPVQAAVLAHLIPRTRTLSLFPSRDVAISSPTGSGKTLCYVLPILNSLVSSDTSSVFAIVVAPLVLLANQIYSEFEKYNCHDTNVVLLAGTQSYQSERRRLFPVKGKPSTASVIVATPERLVEHLTDLSGRLDLSKLRYLVVDEADRMTNLNRSEWLALVEERANLPAFHTTALRHLTDARCNRFLQKILVSATINLDAERLYVWNLRAPMLFAASAGQQASTDSAAAAKPKATSKALTEYVSLPSTLVHKVLLCKQQEKPLDVYCWIRSNEDWKRVIVFVNTRDSSRRLSHLLSHMLKGLVVAELSPMLIASRRKAILTKFREGHVNVVISTDNLARGIDVGDVDAVINYDLPMNERAFVHRAGRTARAGKGGTCLSFVTKNEKCVLKKILSKGGHWVAAEFSTRNEDILMPKDNAKYKKALEQLKKEFSTGEK